MGRHCWLYNVDFPLSGVDRYSLNRPTHRRRLEGGAGARAHPPSIIEMADIASKNREKFLKYYNIMFQYQTFILKTKIYLFMYNLQNETN